MSKKGRPPKKNYDADKQFEELLHMVDYVYDTTGEINATATEVDMSTVKVKKLLITSGKLEYDETKQIQRLMAYGKNLSEIQEEIGLKKSSINSYLPYTKVPYKDTEVSANADRCDLYRRRKAAVEALSSLGNTGDFGELWKTIELFEGYSFFTASGLKFDYGVNEEELVIRGKERRITRKSVEKIYNNLSISGKSENPAETEYIYPIFCRLGIVDNAGIGVDIS